MFLFSRLITLRKERDIKKIDILSRRMTDPILYDVVDTLYHGVMNHMPEALQTRDMLSAFLLGGSGIYCVVRSLQWMSRNMMDGFIANFDEKVIPVLEKICIISMGSAPFIYAAVDPEGAREMVMEHPVYTAGMAGVYIGSITGAVQDLGRRARERVSGVDELLLDCEE